MHARLRARRLTRYAVIDAVQVRRGRCAPAGYRASRVAPLRFAAAISPPRRRRGAIYDARKTDARTVAVRRLTRCGCGGSRCAPTGHRASRVAPLRFAAAFHRPAFRPAAVGAPFMTPGKPTHARLRAQRLTRYAVIDAVQVRRGRCAPAGHRASQVAPLRFAAAVSSPRPASGSTVARVETIVPPALTVSVNICDNTFVLLLRTDNAVKISTLPDTPPDPPGYSGLQASDRHAQRPGYGSTGCYFRRTTEPMHVRLRCQGRVTFRQQKMDMVRHDSADLHTKQAISRVETKELLLHDMPCRRRFPHPIVDTAQKGGVTFHAKRHEIIPFGTIVKMTEPHGAALNIIIFHLTKIVKGKCRDKRKPRFLLGLAEPPPTPPP